MFVYSFTIKGYNVIVTIEFFPHVVILENFFSLDPMDDDFGDVDTLLIYEIINGLRFILFSHLFYC